MLAQMKNDAPDCPFDLLDEATQYAPLARRNQMIGLWAGRRLGLSGPELAAYVREVMESDLIEPGEGDIVAKVAGDLVGTGLADPAATVWRQLRQHHAEAYRQFAVTD